MPDEENRFKPQQRKGNEPQPQRQPGSITPFNRTGRLPPASGGTGKLPSFAPRGGTGKLPPIGPVETPPQGSPFAVRLDPNAKPGEFNFVIESPEAVARVPAAAVMEADASNPIPPVLYKAVDEVLGFIYGLDNQFESQGRRPRK